MAFENPPPDFDPEGGSAPAARPGPGSTSEERRAFYRERGRRNQRRATLLVVASIVFVLAKVGFHVWSSDRDRERRDTERWAELRTPVIRVAKSEDGISDFTVRFGNFERGLLSAPISNRSWPGDISHIVDMARFLVPAASPTDWRFEFETSAPLDAQERISRSLFDAFVAREQSEATAKGR